MSSPSEAVSPCHRTDFTWNLHLDHSIANVSTLLPVLGERIHRLPLNPFSPLWTFYSSTGPRPHLHLSGWASQIHSMTPSLHDSTHPVTIPEAFSDLLVMHSHFISAWHCQAFRVTKINLNYFRSFLPVSTSFRIVVCPCWNAPRPFWSCSVCDFLVLIYDLSQFNEEK